MSYFLGIDAGGTKSEFVLGDEVRELARVRKGTIQRQRIDAQTAETNLREALSDLVTGTGINMREIKRCCIGTSGETVPLVVDWLRDAFERHLGVEVILVGDVEVALDAAFRGRRGVLVLAGTVSNVAGRAVGGSIITAGGWGPILADQGSGNFLGREGLRRGFLAIDQERPTILLEAVRAHWHLASLGELIERANSNPAPDFSHLAPVIVACAAKGDSVAQEVLAQGGTDLAYLAGLLIERIRVLEGTATSHFEPPDVAIAGSILAHVTPVRRALEASLRRRYSDVAFEHDPVDPPSGALWRARQGLSSC